MFVPFESLPDHSRIWVYQSNRKLNCQELNIISDTLRAFTKRWNVHSTPLPSSFDMRFDQFVILAADEDAFSASGCSIDDSVRTIKDLGKLISADFFDRTQMAFKNNEIIVTIAMNDLKEQYRLGAWNDESLFFNNLVSVKSDLESLWLVPATSAWVKRYIPGKTVDC